jgi:hypothetical protein
LFGKGILLEDVIDIVFSIPLRVCLEVDEKRNEILHDCPKLGECTSFLGRAKECDTYA